MTIKTPNWVKHAVFYQIFPDRFARSQRTHHPPGITFKEWGSPPEEQGFQGGDLRGIVDKLDYLEKLGVTALYLNPIFASAANHRYHTYDYFQVDPLLGGDEALRELLDEAHARDMRVVLDGVFNHAGRGFWPFHHILENGPDSPYVDWFIIYDWPLQPYPNRAEESSKEAAKKEKDVKKKKKSEKEAKKPERKQHNYAAWWDLPALPKLNTDNPGVREYIFSVARYWLEFGIDGWRLDVPAEIDDDEFWRKFRDIVKEVDSDAYICGEIWSPAQRWLRGDMFDAVMNYVITGPMLSFFGAETLPAGYKKRHIKLEPLAAIEFAEAIEEMLDLYDWEINTAQLNMLDSHDMARALWIVGEDQSALRLCVLFMMCMPGAPCIYYGDEIGLSGFDDPHCRAAFPWDDEDSWETDLLEFYRQAVALRHEQRVLRTGRYRTVHAENQVYAFYRRLDDEEAVVAFNVAQEPATLTVTVPDVQASTFSQVWPAENGSDYELDDTEVTLEIPARSGIVLVAGG